MDHELRRHLRDTFRARLLDATAERSQRQEFVPTPDGSEILWVLHERDVMLRAVNNWRELNGLPPVTVDAVRRVEGSAEGHVDYVDKFALGCAELAMQEA